MDISRHTHAHANMVQQRETRGFCLCLCAAKMAKKPPGSYIKFSMRHKPSSAMTLSGKVPNDIYQLGLNSAVAFFLSLLKQALLIYLLSW